MPQKNQSTKNKAKQRINISTVRAIERMKLLIEEENRLLHQDRAEQQHRLKDL